MRLLPIEERWFVAIADAVLPCARAGVPPPGSLPVGRFAGAFFRRAPTSSALAARAALWAVALAPLIRRGRALDRLGTGEREALLRTMHESGIYVLREMVDLLKILVAMGWEGFPQVQEGLGMPAHDAVAAPWTGVPGAEPPDGITT